MPENKRSGEKTNERKPFFASSFYDKRDIDAAGERVYDAEMDPVELKRRRRRDWLLLLVGVPAFIAVIYLMALLFKGAR